MKSTPVNRSRLVRNSDIDQGRPMSKLRSIFRFIYVNRRIIGGIAGSILVLAGYPNEGTIVNSIVEGL